MKILTIVGTRPEYIRLSQVIPKLDKYCDHILVDTGQNYDKNLRDIFYKELNIRKPDYYLGARGSFCEQVSMILTGLEKIIKREKPDKFYVLGDTNSSVGSICAKRMGVKVYHSEAGNRCYDPNSPEEVNRKIIDHTSDILLPYTQNSKDRLSSEGIPIGNIFVTGNPIREVIEIILDKINYKKVLNKYKLKKNQFFLVTMHRQENVDDPKRLKMFLTTFNMLADIYNVPIVISTHPRLKKNIEFLEYKKICDPLLRFEEPFGFKDFISLELTAKCVITDSGTVMEETSIVQTPCVVIRDTTERPECQECGAVSVTGCNESTIIRCIDFTLNTKLPWVPPYEYTQMNVSDTIVKILLGR